MKRLRQLTIACITAGAVIAVLLAWEASSYSQNQDSSNLSNDLFEPTPGASKLAPLITDVPARPAPERTVFEFLDAVRAGKKEAAVKLLSQRSRETNAVMAYNLMPPNSPNAEFTLTGANYLSSKRDTAHVSSRWVSVSNAEGKQTVYESIWALRKEPDGWRIVGAIQKLLANAPPVALNFEDPDTAKQFEQKLQEQMAQHETAIDQAVPVVGDSAQKASAPQASTDPAPEANDAPPDKVVTSFLEAIRRGDNQSAVSLLCATARKKYQAAGFNIALPGNPKAKFAISKVDYDKGAYVSTQWTQPNRLGEPQMHEVGWYLIKESDGWRIMSSSMRFPLGSEPLQAYFDHDPFDAQQKIANFLELINGPAVLQENPQSTVAAEEPNSNGSATKIPLAAGDPTIEGISVKVFALKYARATELASQIQKMYREDAVADERTNSVIIRGSEYAIGDVSKFIQLLDVAGPERPWGQKPQTTESRPGERDVFAQVDGVVTEVLVKTGDDVKAGQELVKLKNSELDLRLKQQAVDKAAADAKFKRLETLHEAGQATFDELLAAQADVEKLNVQHELDQQTQQLLTVKSPIDGKVVTPNLREKLIERPVAKGELLLILAMKGVPPTPVSQNYPTYSALQSPPVPETAYGQSPSPPRYAQALSPFDYSPKKVVKSADSPYQKAEQKAGKLATEYQSLTGGEKSNGTLLLTNSADSKLDMKMPTDNQQKKLEDLKAEIRCEVEIAFKARQQAQQAELEALRKKLNQIETSLNNREKNREAIINRRVEELINPDVKWDVGAAAPQSGNPFRANAPMPTSAGAGAPPGGVATRQVPVTTAREVDTPDGKKMVYEESMREETVYGELPKSTATAPANGLSSQQSAPTLTSPPKVSKSDLDAIQGKWKSEAIVSDGKFEDGVTTMEFSKEIVTMHPDDGDPPGKCFYKLDPSKSPKWIDLSNLDGKSYHGIYEIEGDQLKICLSDAETDKRPTAFESTPKLPNHFMILKHEMPVRSVEPPRASALKTH